MPAPRKELMKTKLIKGIWEAARTGLPEQLEDRVGNTRLFLKNIALLARNVEGYIGAKEMLRHDKEEDNIG